MVSSALAIAGELMREHDGKTKFHPLRAGDGILTEADAYAVQGAYVDLLRSRYGEAAGYKIGLTSARMQALCGIDRPVAGIVLDNRVWESGCTLSLDDFGRLGVEFEIGVRIGADLHPSGRLFTPDTIADSVSGICAAVEVVDDRGADYAELTAFSLIADNSWNAGIILGDWRSSWPPLDEIQGKVSLDGREIDSGYGRDVMGHPFVPLAWLANHLAAQGGGLKAGDIVLTGSLIVTQFPNGPGAFRYEIGGIGDVEFNVTA